MSLPGLLDRWVQNLHYRHGQSVSLSLGPFWRIHSRESLSSRDRLSWRSGSGRRSWFCEVGLLKRRFHLHTNVSGFSTSTGRGSTDLRYHMSRLRSTLDSVSKAVSGTQAEILSRISQLKSRSSREESDRENASDKEQERETNTSLTPPTDSAQTPPTQTPPTDSAQTPPTQPPSAHSAQTPPTIVSVNKIREQKERRVRAATANKINDTSITSQTKTPPPVAPPSNSLTPKKTTPLFHPSSLSLHLGESYNYLSHHINSYFVSFVKTEEPKSDDEDGVTSSSSPHAAHQHQQISVDTSSVTPAGEQPPAPGGAASSSFSLSKGLGSYFTYSAPSVQAFVGSYITPLVPRFRSELKNSSAEALKPSPTAHSTVKLTETAESREQRAAEEKARRLLIQREKIIARVSVDNRTRALVRALQRASDVRLYISRVEELTLHLLHFPETRSVAVKERVVPCLLRLRQACDPCLKAAVREALALVGYIDPVKNRGIRILSIDGGGTRGLVALQSLHRLEELSGKSIYQLFDYICGVSTGAILGFMLGVLHIPLSECEELYRRLSSDVFKQNVIVGTMKMSWNHAFYDTEIWEKVLKEKMGSDLLIETSRDPDCPKVAAVSTVVNRGPPVKAYVFRNYTLPAGVRSHYRGGCQHRMWEAVRASSAAPGYFQEFTLGNDLHQDGGLLINNPTALALHECQCLWPGTPLQCVVSLGTGRFETTGKHNISYTSLKTKLTNIISSATDTEEVHTMLDALLPPHTYFRFNPYMSEEVSLDESRDEKLNLLLDEGRRYLERNEEKLKRAVDALAREKSSAQRAREWIQLRAHMYDALYKQ